MAAYSIVRIDVHDADAYDRYREFASKAIAEFDGEILVRGGKTVVKEGDARARNVVIRFKDLQTAEAFYDSPTYQEGLKYALPASTRDFVLVEGV